MNAQVAFRAAPAGALGGRGVVSPVLAPWLI